ncbi:hypothetical protein RUND412_003825 [Rhizina undulata]
MSHNTWAHPEANSEAIRNHHEVHEANAFDEELEYRVFAIQWKKAVLCSMKSILIAATEITTYALIVLSLSRHFEPATDRKPDWENILETFNTQIQMPEHQCQTAER